MNEDKTAEVKKEGKGMAKWLMVVIAIVVIAIIAVGAWMLTRGDESSTSDEVETSDTAAFTPKHADWQKFTSSKYKFDIYYPADYTVAESAVGTLTFSKAGAVMVDMYVTVASTSGDPVAAAIAPYMDDARGYMTSAAEVDTTVADGIETTMVTGTLGAKMGITSQVGKKGTAAMFVKNGNLFTFDSFYNNVVADFTIYEDMLKDLRFN